MGCNSSKTISGSKEGWNIPLMRSLSRSWSMPYQSYKQPTSSHAVALTSSTLGAFERNIHEESCDSDEDEGPGEVVDPSPARTRKSWDRPEVIDVWELMEDLNKPKNKPRKRARTYCKSASLPSVHGLPLVLEEDSPKQGLFYGTPLRKNVLSSENSPESDEDWYMVKLRSENGKLLNSFEWKCPPGGEDKVVLYFTSLHGIRKTYEQCRSVRMILEGMFAKVDERDVSMDAEFRREIKDLLGNVAVPRLFIKGRYIGGAEDVCQLNESGLLRLLLEGMPKETMRKSCDGCGDARFVPCMQCSGSCKVVDEEDQVVRCWDCNENGLVRCPVCC